MPKVISNLSKRQLRRKINQRVTKVLHCMRYNQAHQVVNSQVSFNSPSPCEVYNNFETISESSRCKRANELYDSSDILSGSEVDNLKERLKIWSVTNNISQIATSELLKLLQAHKCFENFPLDSRALLKTVRSFKYRTVKPGKYVHLGFDIGLQTVIQKLNFIPDEIGVLINIDGIPVSKSSKSEFWPILCCLESGDAAKKPFCVGVYHGGGKPEDQNDFLKDFVAEVKALERHGYSYHGVVIKFKVKGFICDAPARAFITCTKYHSGFSSCSKCTQTGERYENRVVFSSKVVTKRSQQSFLQQNDEDHHRGTTILTEINVDLVNDVPFEFMHLICLGVVRKLLNLWVNGKPKYMKFSGLTITNLSRDLVKQRYLTPGDFNRKPRSLVELPRWKATEFRQFVLYTGPVVLQDKIPQTYLNHFNSLHLAVFILSNNDLIRKHGSYANTLLKYFVEQFSSLYGKENISYNVHGLLHVCDDVKVFGNLNNYSAFPFENYLGQLKNLIKGGNRPLAQVCRRLSERDKIHSSPTTEEACHTAGPLLEDLNSPQFNKYYLKSSFLTSDNRNCYCKLRTGEIIKVFNFATRKSDKKLCVIGKPCCELSALYSIPFDSREFGIYKFKTLGELDYWETTEILHKLIAVAANDSSIAVFPLHQ